MPSSAARPARPPRADSWPSRRDASRRRRGLGATPGTVTRSEHKSGLRGRFSGGKGGVAPSPALRPKAEGGSRRQAVETQRGQRVPTTAATERHERKYAHKGVPTSAHPKAAPGTTPASLAGRSRAWPATPQRPAIPANCRRRLAGPPVGRGRGGPDRGGPGSRSSVPSVPSAAPPGPPRGPGARRPVRSKVVYVPGAAPFGSGFPAIQDRAAPSGSPFWESLVTARVFIHLWRHASGPAGRVPVWRPAFQAVSVVWLGGGSVAAGLRPACRLKPAFQAVPPTSALERHAEVGAALSGWGCDVRGAERRGCRSETGGPSRRDMTAVGVARFVRLRRTMPAGGRRSETTPRRRFRRPPWPACR